MMAMPRLELERAWRDVCAAVYKLKHVEDVTTILFYKDGTVKPSNDEGVSAVFDKLAFHNTYGEETVLDAELVRELMCTLEDLALFEYALPHHLEEFLEERLGYPHHHFRRSLQKRRGVLKYQFHHHDRMHHLEIQWIDKYRIPFVGTIATTEYEDIESLIIAVGKDPVERALDGEEVEVEIIDF